MRLGVRTKSFAGVALLMLAGMTIAGVKSVKMTNTEPLVVSAKKIDLTNQPYLSTEGTKMTYGFYNSTGAWQSSATDRGKVVVLYFWATWCQPCEVMTEWMDRIWQRHHDSISMTAIALDTEIETIQRAVRVRRLEMPYAFIPKEIISQADGIRGTPMIFVFSKTGRLVKKIEGVVDEKLFETEIVHWLEQ